MFQLNITSPIFQIKYVDKLIMLGKHWVKAMVPGDELEVVSSDSLKAGFVRWKDFDFNGKACFTSFRNFQFSTSFLQPLFTRMDVGTITSLLSSRRFFLFHA